MKKQDHFIIWNFKSWRIKSGLIFSFRAILQSLRPFSISRPIFQKIAKKGSKWLKFEKIRPLLFLQLLKFHNIKWTYFFNFRVFWPFFYFGQFLLYIYGVCPCCSCVQTPCFQEIQISYSLGWEWSCNYLNLGFQQVDICSVFVLTSLGS